MFDDTTTGSDTSGCCPALTPDPLPVYEPPLPAPLPAPVAVPATTWLDEAPAVGEPAPLVIEPAPMAAPIAAAPATGASAAFEPSPSGSGAALVITADPSATTSLYPGADTVDAMLENARSGLGSAPPMPLAPAGALLPATADPSLWGSAPLPGGLSPTGDVDGDGIDNASDNAPFTPAPRRP